MKYSPQYNDYYCNSCHSYQTHSESINIGGKKSPAYKIDSNPPPKTPPKLPPTWQNNIPMFRHREYLVIQAIMSWGAKYTIYNVTGHVMGQIKGKIVSFGGEWNFFDYAGRKVANVKGNPAIFGFQERKFEIRDYKGRFKGVIKGKFGLLKRSWELYDMNGQLIGRPDEQLWLKINWRMVDPSGRILLTVDKKWFTFRDQFRVIVSEHIDPLVALAYAVVIDHLYFRGDK